MSDRQLANDTLEMLSESDIPLSRYRWTTTVPWRKNQSLLGLSDTEKEEAKVFYRFYNKFPKTKLFQQIRKFTPDIESAANVILSWMEARQERSGSDSRFKYKNFISVLSSILREAQDYCDEMVSSICKDAGNGDCDIDKLQKKLEILDTMIDMDMRFSFASAKAEKRDVSFFPEDDTEPKLSRPDEMPFYGEMCLPDDIFYKRFANHELHAFEHIKTTTEVKRFRMCIDVSGSMENKRIVNACAAGISLVRNAKAGKNEADIILFDNKAREPRSFNNVQECVDFLMSVPFSGGGTSIDDALKKADTEGIETIVMITDGDDHVTYKPSADLFTILVGGDNKSLRSMSKKCERLKC